MLSADRCVPLETIESVESTFGLSEDFKSSSLTKYPKFFSVKEINGRACLQLENWDSLLAVTA